MKEIKFRYRFLNRKTKELIMTCLTIDQVENQGLNPNPFRGFDWHILSRDLYIVIRDKHGKEIYEGDIVKWGHNVNTIGEGMGVCFDGGFEEGIGVITINQCGIWIGDDNPFFDFIQHCEGGMDENIHEMEIIGNIYENPELVEAT